MELTDRCQCCFTILPREWLAYRCGECLNGGHCTRCGKCELHCEHVKEKTNAEK